MDDRFELHHLLDPSRFEQDCSLVGTTLCVTSMVVAFVDRDGVTAWVVIAMAAIAFIAGTVAMRRRHRRLLDG